MRFQSKRGSGLRGALAILFMAGAGGGIYALAHRAPPPPASEPPLASKPTTASLAPAQPSKGSSLTLPASSPKQPEPKPAEKPAKPAQPETTNMIAGSSGTANPTIAQAEAALAKGDDRAGLLSLRATAKARTPSPEQELAKDRLAKIAAAALEEASKRHESGDLQGERAALSRAFFALLDKTARAPVRERLDEIVKQTVLSIRPSDDGDVYTVKPGDRLITIARAHKTAFTLIKRASGLKSDSLRVGQKLKIPKGQVELAVFKTDFVLVATIGGRYLKAWDVGTGKEDRTPEATFKISERISEPTWYSPDGKVYPFGTKENILGTRWLGFERTPELAGFGIHGTAFPESIGTEASMGCIRMRNEDVEEVYDLVPEGSEVRIVR